MTSSYCTNESAYREKLANINSSLLASGWCVTSKQKFIHYLSPAYALPGQGWKIHISCQASEVSRMLDTVFPILSNEKISFKIAATYNGIIACNAGEYGLSQLGKILTIYPENTSRACELGRRLDELWNSPSAPTPVSNLYFSSDGSVSVRYGAIDYKRMVRDASLQLWPALVKPDGVLVPDIPSSDASQVEWTSPLPGQLHTLPSYNREKEYLKKIDDGRYIPIYTFSSRTFTTTFACIEKEKMNLVLVKMFFKKSGEDANEYTYLDKAKNEAHIARLLATYNVAPPVFATYEDKSFYYIVYSYIDGKPFSKLPKEDKIQKLPLLFMKVWQMHDLGVVHRNLKFENIILIEGDIYFIDFELSGKTGAARPFIDGTRNYIAPEGACAIVHPSYDCYSLGSCLIHAYSETDPSILPSDTNKRIACTEIYMPGNIAALVKALYAHGPYPAPHSRYGT